MVDPPHGRYVRHLDTTVHALHIKTKLCQLVEATMARRDDLAFRQEMKFRNKLVEYLTDWVMGNSHQMAPPGCGDVTAITRDLDQACMQAVAALLLGLPLQPEESDRGDLMEAKSQLFLKYFSLFMNLLNECSEAAPEEKDRHRLQSSKLGELRTCTIQAMSNLLSANIDSGLMHSIGERGPSSWRAAPCFVTTGQKTEAAALTSGSERRNGARDDVQLRAYSSSGELSRALFCCSNRPVAKVPNGCTLNKQCII